MQNVETSGYQGSNIDAEMFRNHFNPDSIAGKHILEERFLLPSVEFMAGAIVIKEAFAVLQKALGMNKSSQKGN